MSLSPQDIINAALSANAVALGSGEAAKFFRDSLKGSIVVKENLDRDDIAYLQKHCTFPLVFSRSKTVTHDHAPLAAMRAIVREAYEKLYHIKTTKERCLVVGSSSREMRLYDSNHNIHHYLSGVEGKDVERIVRPVLNEIIAQVRKKVPKNDRDIFEYPKGDPRNQKYRVALKRYKDLTQMLDDLTNLKNLPKTYHTIPVDANTLLFEDTIYNFNEDTITNLFKQTGATIAYGYALLPMELLFKDLPENPMYRFHINPDTRHATLTFRHGYSNGYTHQYDDWCTLLKKPLLVGHGVQIGVELQARVGPMCMFKLYRTEQREIICRTIELPESMYYVRLLDLWGSVNHRTCKINTPLKYFSANESEFFETVNYLLSLDPKSLNFQNCMTYVRRRMGGISLATRDVPNAWELTRADQCRFATACTLYAYVMHEKTDKSIKEAEPMSVWAKIKRVFGYVMREAFYPVAYIYELIMSENLTDRIVLFPEQFSNQEARSKKLRKSQRHEIPLYICEPDESDKPLCPVCREFLAISGEEQEIECHHLEESEFELTLTAEEVNVWINELIDDDNDPIGLKMVKKRAKEALVPDTPIVWKGRIELVVGGPGTGKSHWIKAMATKNDMILAPFTKLRKDYIGLENDDGEKYDLYFQTNHRAVAANIGARIIYVDEFTAFDFRFLVASAAANKTEMIYLCGDPKQTKLQEPSEGMYIGNHVNLEHMSRHELIVNFRNPVDTVYMLNAMYGYHMKPCKRALAQKTQPSIKKLSIAEADHIDGQVLRMAFTHVSAKRYTGEERNTVRANQGQSYPVCMLYVTDEDRQLPFVSELGIVALSRHQETLYIVTDDCPTSIKFLNDVSVSQKFKDHLQEEVPIPRVDTKAVEILNPDAMEDINPMYHPPKDSHLLSESLMNNYAMNPEINALNEEGSVMVPDQFRSARTTEAAAVGMEPNPRGHPQTKPDTWLAFCPGDGTHFDPKNVFSEWAIFAERYDNKNRPKHPINPAQMQYIDKMVDSYFMANKKDISVDQFLGDDNMVQAFADKFVADAKKKHYYEQFRGFLDGNDQLKNVRFAIKLIFKPTTVMKDLELAKAGQGISAVNADVSSHFCFAWRLLAFWDKITDGKGGLIDDICLTPNYSSSAEFSSSFTEAMNEVTLDGLVPAKHGIIDGKYCDAGQDAKSIYLEERYWTKAGVSPQFLGLYYCFRRDMNILGRFTKSKQKTEKLSGEPGTLINNSVIFGVIGDWVIRVTGRAVKAKEGDDFDKFGAEARVDQERQQEVSGIFGIQLRFSIEEYGEFCGCVVSPAGCFPNMLRRLKKICARRYKSYGDFCIYQISLRDYVKEINMLGLEDCISTCSFVNGTTIEESFSVYYAINAWSHLSKEQFYEVMQVHEGVFFMPKSDGKAVRVTS